MIEIAQNPFADISINQIEYGRIVGNQPHESDTFKINIPKLMIRASKNTITFNKSIFANAPTCRILSKNVLNTVNYITVKRSPSCDFSSIAVDGCISDGTIVMCACINGDIKDIIIISAVDGSYVPRQQSTNTYTSTNYENGIILKDKSTGKDYEISVDYSELYIEEVE